jgi:hypothetical protein
MGIRREWLVKGSSILGTTSFILPGSRAPFTLYHRIGYGLSLAMAALGGSG